MEEHRNENLKKLIHGDVIKKNNKKHHNNIPMSLPKGWAKPNKIKNNNNINHSTTESITNNIVLNSEMLIYMDNNNDNNKSNKNNKAFAKSFMPSQTEFNIK